MEIFGDPIDLPTRIQSKNLISPFLRRKNIFSRASLTIRRGNYQDSIYYIFNSFIPLS